MAVKPLEGRPLCLPISFLLGYRRAQPHTAVHALSVKENRLFAMAQSMPQPPPLVMDAGEISAQPSPRVMDASEISATPRGSRGVTPRTPRTPRAAVTPRPLISPCNGSTSQSAFLTGVEPARSPSFSDKVESCIVPGIDDCGELPRGSKPARQLMREGTLLVHFASRSHEVQFGHCWASKPCEEMLVAFVWHVVCQHFKPDPEAADALFSKLAASYATLHGTTLVTTEAKDAASW